MKAEPLLHLLSWILMLNVNICEASSCTDHTCVACGSDALNLVCEPGQTVTGFIKAGWRNLQTASVYTNDTGQCGYVHGDCYAEENIMLNRVKLCMWHKSECTFSINPFISHIRGPFHNCTSTDNFKAMYLTAFNFHCVPDNQIHTLCLSEPSILVADDVTVPQYLISVDFPREYAQYNSIIEEFCSVEIHVMRGYGIRIWSLFMDITNPDKKDGSCLMEHLRLSHPEQNADVELLEYCGRTNFSLDWPHSGLVVHFVVEQMIERIAQLREGFVLRYGRYKLPAVVTPTTPQQSTTQKITTTTHKVHTSAEAQSMGPANSDSTVVLMTILIPALLFLLVMVSATTLLIYRGIRHKNKAYSPTNQYTATVKDRQSDSDSSISVDHGSV